MIVGFIYNHVGRNEMSSHLIYFGIKMFALCNVCRKCARVCVCVDALYARHRPCNRFLSHSSAGSYVCRVCGKKYKYYNCFQTHVRAHRGKAPAFYRSL